MEPVTNNRQALIQGLSDRLMKTYMAEIVCRSLGHYEASYWYSCRRRGLRADLEMLLKGA